MLNYVKLSEGNHCKWWLLLGFTLETCLENPPAIIRCFSHSTYKHLHGATRISSRVDEASHFRNRNMLRLVHLDVPLDFKQTPESVKASWRVDLRPDFPINFEALAGWSSKCFCLAYLHPGGWHPSSKLFRLRRDVCLTHCSTCFRENRATLQRGKTSQQHAANSKAPQLIKPSGYLTILT